MRGHWSWRRWEGGGGDPLGAGGVGLGSLKGAGAVDLGCGGGFAGGECDPGSIFADMTARGMVSDRWAGGSGEEVGEPV